MHIDVQTIPERFRSAAEEFCRSIGISESGGGTHVSFRQGTVLAVMPGEDSVEIEYENPRQIFRALTFLPTAVQRGTAVREEPFRHLLCFMADQSRNAVYNLKTAKQMIRYLAAMGYNGMMLYTEDTYTIAEYPSFGHMRGRFSEDELRELDDYAYGYGIELIPCIQTLSHLETAIRWPAFRKLKEDGKTLLTGSEDTYGFIRSAIAACKRCFRSRRIHIGMDEAEGIGKGKYLHFHDYRPTGALMLEHLNRVTAICAKAGLRPMIWSDMFFRMTFGGKYYVRDGSVPPEAIKAVPENVDLVYWDYYNEDPEILEHMMSCHEQFGRNMIFAPGAWNWSGFAADNRFSVKLLNEQFPRSRAHRLNDLILTSWGDDGAEASRYSVLPTQLAWAEACYGHLGDPRWLSLRARQCFGTDWDTLLLFDLPNQLPGVPEKPVNPCKYLLFNDPFERLLDHHVDPNTAAECYRRHSKTLLEHSKDETFGYALETLGYLCLVLANKCDLGIRLHNAYRQQDRDRLKEIAEGEIPELSECLRCFIDCFRRQWYRENKPFGFSVQELRLGGLMERLRSVRLRLLEYLSGEISEIPELEIPPISMRSAEDEIYIRFQNWKPTASPGVL